MTDIRFEGETAAGFEPVAEAFRANFRRQDDYRETGAALAVYWRGRRVVHLWGGEREPDGAGWTSDTLVNVWSATKGLMAAVMARLVERGLVDYEAPVARYWPQFAENGKADIRVIDVLSHRSGLNGFRAPTTIEEFPDWELLTTRLAAQAPFWPPRSHASYHAMTYGFLAGEIARRVTGRSPRELFRTELALPLTADVHLGLPDDARGRAAPIIEPAQWSTSPAGAPDPIAEPAAVNPAPRPDWANREDWRAAQVPAANGHASADGLARVYGALANDGELDGVRFLSPATIAAMSAARTEGPDHMLGPRRWAAGMSLNASGGWGPNPDAFGHAGWGGAFGCADPRARVGIGYVMNRMGGKVAEDPRAAALCAAVHACLARLG
jgi:CubicO group peptidase (beta-lactamase class C family)